MRAWRKVCFLLTLLLPGTVLADVTVIENVSVLPMDRPGVLADHVVEVRDGVITYVGPREKYKAPTGVHRIDGGRGYLMPGLADMHMHIVNDESAAATLGHYLAYGVTTIRTLSGNADVLALRQAVASGSILGPRIWVSGPVIIGTDPDTASHPDPHSQMEQQWFTTASADKARGEVDRQKAAGYDLVKVYDMLPEDAYQAAVAEARRKNIYVTGHLPDAVPLATALRSGLSEVAHADELVSYHWIGYDPKDDDWSSKLLSFTMDYDSIPQTVALLKANKLSVLSNLVTDETIYRLIADPETVLRGPEYQAINPITIAAWKGGRTARWKGQDAFRRDVIQPFLRKLVKAMADQNVPLLVGSDVTVEGMVPGFHLLRDVELLAEAGVAPYDALKAATVNAAATAGRMGKDDKWGSLRVGNRADLVLLRSNPLDRISSLYETAGVMVAGRWLDLATIEKMRSQQIDIRMSK